MSEKLEIAYWKCRGRAACMRMIMHYRNQDFNDNMHLYGHHAYQNENGWFDVVKPSLQKEDVQANLPFIVDGDIQIFQSMACVLYLARKLDLHGSSEKEIVRNETVLFQAKDVFDDIAALVYHEDDDGPAFLKRAQEWLSSKALNWLDIWERSLEQGGTNFFAADRPLVCDFSIYETVDHFEQLAKDIGAKCILPNYPKVVAWRARMRNLEGMQKYHDEQPMKCPQQMSNFASWGNGRELGFKTFVPREEHA